MAESAWIVRMNTGGGDVAPLGRELGMLLLGWATARGLDEPSLEYDAFRARVHAAHYASDTDFKRSGRAARSLWKFMREMESGDWVVVPRPGSFWVGRVAGDAFETDEGTSDDTVHRRPVEWHDQEPVPRARARSALVSRMKSRLTVTDASDLLEDIKLALEVASSQEAPSGTAALRGRLIEETHQELLAGYFNERRFEELVRDVLMMLGAAGARIIPRRHDVGIDIACEFPVGGLTVVPVGVQVKYWRPEQGPAGREPIDQLLVAMDDVEIGLVVTTTSFSDDARAYASELAEESGKDIVLLDGLEFSQLLVDHGLRELLA